MVVWENWNFKVLEILKECTLENLIFNPDEIGLFTSDKQNPVV